MNKKNFIAVLLTISTLALQAAAVFELKESGKSYTLNFNGKPLIVGEGFTPEIGRAHD